MFELYQHVYYSINLEVLEGACPHTEHSNMVSYLLKYHLLPLLIVILCIMFDCSISIADEIPYHVVFALEF